MSRIKGKLFIAARWSEKIFNIKAILINMSEFPHYFSLTMMMRKITLRMLMMISKIVCGMLLEIYKSSLKKLPRKTPIKLSKGIVDKVASINNFFSYFNTITWLLMLFLLRTKFHYFILLPMVSERRFSISAKMIKRMIKGHFFVWKLRKEKLKNRLDLSFEHKKRRR